MEPNLPTGWIWTTVDDISESIQYGFTESANENPVGPRFLRITDIQNNQVVWDKVPYVVCSEEESRKYHLIPGDIVFARTGATTGKSYLINSCPDAVFASYLIRLRLKEKINAKYFSYFLNSSLYWSQITSVKKGSAQPGVNASVLASIKLPIAPLPEQERIVARIETLFSRLDAGVAALKRAQAALKRYRASVLKAACEGRLATQDPNDEPAGEMLKRIAPVGAQRRCAPTEGLPELPAGWCWARIGDFSKLIQYGTSEKADQDETGIVVLRMGNIQEGQLDFSNLKYINGGTKGIDSLVLGRGDLLFNRTNSAELVGKSAVYKEFHPKATFASYLIRVKLNEEIQPDYIAFYINSVFGREYIKTVVSQQVGQANVNGTKLANMQISLPPSFEQIRIVSEVERILSVIQEMETTISANLARSARMRQAILKRAFEGRLGEEAPR